jgi:serine/threonine protein kinase
MEELFLKSHEVFLKEEAQFKININNFTLLKVIGKGSYAKVALVRKKDNNKIYAMKILKKDYIRLKKQVSHIKTERSILVFKKTTKIKFYLKKKNLIWKNFENIGFFL